MGCNYIACVHSILAYKNIVNIHCILLCHDLTLSILVPSEITIWERIYQLLSGLSIAQHTQNTASAPSHPIQHSTAGDSTPMAPMGLVMAGCWQINSILTNIGRRNSIRILNQYPFFWKILTQFICFINLFRILKIKVALISCRWSKVQSKAGENNGLIRPPAESVPSLNNTEIAPISSPNGVGVKNQTTLASPLGSELVGVIWLTPCSAYGVISYWQLLPPFHCFWHDLAPGLVHPWRT